MADKKKALNCICSKQGCWRGDISGIPESCQANKYIEEIEKSKDEYHRKDNISIYEAACIVGADRDFCLD